MQLHYATAVEAARSTVLGISIRVLPVLCIVPYPASYKSLDSLIDLYFSLASRLLLQQVPFWDLTGELISLV